MRHPSKDKGVEEGINRCHWVGVTNWLSLFQTSSCLWGTHRTEAMLPSQSVQPWSAQQSRGRNVLKKKLKEYQKGKFQSRTIQVLLAPRCFWSLVKSEELSPSSKAQWDVSHLLPTHRNQACGICSLRLILAQHRCGLIFAWGPNANPLGKPCSPGHFPAIWVIPG